ncbi:MAG: tetratricopeptide repeat protein, partial [Planctomycetota bacterium]|nr:tetratricopeptide repeat protein [Planctomycetota bacterium]
GVEQCDLAATLAGNSAADRAMAEVHRARVLAQGKRYADAVKVYAAVVQDTPLAEAPWLHKEIGNLYESRFDDTGDVRLLEEANLHYRTASVVAITADAEALTLVARALFKKAKAERSEFKDAKEWLEKAKGVAPRYLPARLLSAEIALAEDNAEEARAIVDEALTENSENAEALLTLADLYEKVGKLGEACALLGRVAGQQPANRRVLERHIALCERAGDIDGARRSYTALLALAPTDTSIALKAAELHLQAGDAVAAESALTPICKGAKAPAAAQALLGRARLWQGNERGAEAAFRAALAADPQNAEAMARLALLLADQNRRPTEAMGLAQRASALAADNPLCLDALAAAHIRAGKPAEAMAILQRIPSEQMTCSAWYHLGMARFAAGDREAAREALAQAIEVGGREHGAAAVVERARLLLQQIAVEPPKKKPVTPVPQTEPSPPVSQPEPAPAAEEAKPTPAPPAEAKPEEQQPAGQAPA